MAAKNSLFFWSHSLTVQDFINSKSSLFLCARPVNSRFLGRLKTYEEPKTIRQFLKESIRIERNPKESNGIQRNPKESSVIQRDPKESRGIQRNSREAK